MCTKLRLRGLALLGCLCAHLQAAEPLRVDIQSLGPSGQQFELGGTNISMILTEVVERQGELTSLVGQPFQANLNYLGVPNSVILTISATGDSATLEIPSANFTKTFTASNPDKLDDEIQNFLRKDGSSELAKMRRQVNKESPVGITDGNPNSTTALTAAEFFDALALNPNRQFGDEADRENPARISLISSGAAFNAEPFHGWRASARVQLDYRVHRKLSIVAMLPFNYLNLEGSTVTGFGAGLGMPIAILGNFEERKPRWTFAPFVGGMFRWSDDLAGGGSLITAGLNTALTIPLGQSWEPSAIVQISDYRGVPFSIDGYQLDKVVDQQVLKVGGQLVYRVTDRFLVESYGVMNRFLQDAAIQTWATMGLSLRMRLWETWSLGGGYTLDTGAGYVSNAGNLSIGKRF